MTALLQWQSWRKSLLGLLMINAFFYIVCYLHTSVLALTLLFIVFISGLGTLLHLVYMSTSEEYRDRLHSHDHKLATIEGTRHELKTQ